MHIICSTWTVRLGIKETYLLIRSLTAPVDRLPVEGTSVEKRTDVSVFPYRRQSDFYEGRILRFPSLNLRVPQK